MLEGRKKSTRVWIFVVFLVIATLYFANMRQNAELVKPHMSRSNLFQCKQGNTSQEALRRLALHKEKCPEHKFPVLVGTKPKEISGCDTPHIYIESRGRLGNQICEYLTLAVLRDLFNKSVSMGPLLHQLISESFDGLDIALGKTECARISVSSSTIFNEVVTKYPPHMQLNNSYEINNYPCPIPILLEHRSWFSNLLTFKASILSKADNAIEQALQSKSIPHNGTVLIGMHVRRTDYEKYLKNSKKIDRSFISPFYYREAMDYFNHIIFDQAAFIVASDDLDWCIENLDYPNVVFLGKLYVVENGLQKAVRDTVGFSHEKNTSSPIGDMAALSRCDHHVTGFGTFGFLSAYLSGTGCIMHSYSLKAENTELENAILCSNSTDLIPKPDIQLDT